MGAAQDKYKNRIITIPNVLSLFRLCLIPVTSWLCVYRKDYVWTPLVLALSGITDIVDGIIARKLHMVSDFGKVFDPVADKLTQIAMLLCLLTRFPNMLFPLGILVVKEIFAAVTGLQVIRKTGKVLGAVWHGKAATAALYGMMLVHLLWFHIPAEVSNILTGGCGAMVLLSAVLYGIRNLSILTDRRKPCQCE